MKQNSIEETQLKTYQHEPTEPFAQNELFFQFFLWKRFMKIDFSGKWLHRGAKFQKGDLTYNLILLPGQHQPTHETISEACQ